MTTQAQARPRRAPRSAAPATARKAVTSRQPTRRPVLHALTAAEEAVRRDSMHIRIPMLGELQLPPREEVAFLGGVAALAVVGVLEWPVAVLLGVGHELATNRHNKLLRAFGEALEES
jgi:hypothetical protein